MLSQPLNLVPEPPPAGTGLGPRPDEVGVGAFTAAHAAVRDLRIARRIPRVSQRPPNSPTASRERPSLQPVRRGDPPFPGANVADSAWNLPVVYSGITSHAPAWSHHGYERNRQTGPSADESPVRGPGSRAPVTNGQGGDPHRHRRGRVCRLAI